MKNPKLIYAVVIVVVVGAVLGIWSMFGGENNANFPEGTDWLCMNKSCGNQFKLTMEQLGQHHKQNYGKPVPCPKCGQRAERAQVCPSCNKVFVQMRGMPVCPHCRKPLPPPA